MLSLPPSPREWYDFQWTVALGCTRVSEGCQKCSAEAMTSFSPHLQRYATVQNQKPKWTGTVEPEPGAFRALGGFADSFSFFVCPISDLFHEGLGDAFVHNVLDAIETHDHHTFGLLTKRAERARAFFDLHKRPVPGNLRLGVSVELQKYTDRIEALLAIDRQPGDVRWVSAEPLLGDLSLADYLGPDKINWVAAGGEIDHDPRPCNAEWVRRLRDEAEQAGVPFFTKWILDGQEHRQQPDR